MVENGGRLLRPLHQATQQGHHPFLQPHAMGEAIFLRQQLLALLGVLELGCLQVCQCLFLQGPLLLNLVKVSARLIQFRRRPFPLAPGGGHRLQQGLDGIPTEAVQPAPLLARSAQLLGLALHGEIQQQGPQLLNLGPTHRHTVETMAAGQSLLGEPPLPRQQQFIFRLQLLLP